MCQMLFCGKVEIGVENLAVAHQFILRRYRFFDLYDHLGAAPDVAGCLNHCCARRDILAVRKTAAQACAVFNDLHRGRAQHIQPRPLESSKRDFRCPLISLGTPMSIVEPFPFRNSHETRPTASPERLEILAQRSPVTSPDFQDHSRN